MKNYLQLLLITLTWHHVHSKNTMTIISVWYGNVYARACLDVPVSGITCGWHIQFYFNPVVTALSVYDGVRVTSNGHYYIIKNQHYNSAVYQSQLCLSFTGSNPYITYPKNPNITADFVCTCNSATSKGICRDKTYSFDPVTPSGSNTTTTVVTSSTTTETSTILTSSSTEASSFPSTATSAELPLSTTTVSSPPDSFTSRQTTPSTFLANSTADFLNTTAMPGPLPKQKRHQYMIWKRHHVSVNYRYKYNRVSDFTDCVQWCSYYENCTGFTIYFQHCWSVINEEIKSDRYYQNCYTWKRVD